MLTPWFLPQQMDDAVYTFETLLHQELGKLQGKDDLCKSIQRILERVLKVRAGACSYLGPPVAFTRGRGAWGCVSEVFWGNISF